MNVGVVTARGWVLEVLADFERCCNFMEENLHIAVSTTSPCPLCLHCVHGEHQVWATRGMLRDSQRSVHLARGTNIST